MSRCGVVPEAMPNSAGAAPVSLKQGARHCSFLHPPENVTFMGFRFPG
jgi:hypothetical protein